MKKTYFAFSDVHGYYNELMQSLAEAGFDYDNPSHVAICIGDWSDRGPDSELVYKWLKEMEEKQRCISLQGNHDDFLIEFLEGPVSNFNWRFNGLNTTLDSFLGRTNSFFSWILIDKNLDQQKLTAEDWNSLWYEWGALAREEINTTYPELLDWLKNLRPYFEIENYIFTHASIQSYQNWKEPEKGWNWHHWDKGHFINEQILNTDKKIVVGHFYTSHLREMHNLGSNTDNSILHGPDNQKIFIDGCVPVTGRVNILVINDKEIE